MELNFDLVGKTHFFFFLNLGMEIYPRNFWGDFTTNNIFIFDGVKLFSPLALLLSLSLSHSLSLAHLSHSPLLSPLYTDMFVVSAGMVSPKTLSVLFMGMTIGNCV